MPKQPRLCLRGSRWIFRAKVPADLVKVIGKREIKKTLGTSVYAEALDRARVLSCEADATFAEARRRLKRPAWGDGPLKPLVYREPDTGDDPVPITSLRDTELRQIVLGAFAGWERRSAETRLSEALTEDARQQALAAIADDEAAISGTLANEAVFEVVQSQANRLLAAHGIILDPSSRQYRLVLELTQRALLENARRDRERYQGAYADQAFDPFFNGITEHAAPEVEPSITLENLMDRFKADPGRADRRKMTVASYQFTFRMLREVIGERTPVRRISREDCRRLRDMLTALPPNATKRFPNMTLAQVADHAKTNGLAPLNVQTQQKHLAQTSALFRWAVAEEFMASNPAERLTVAGTGPKTKARRRPYSTEQLNLIFRAPLFAGCEDDERGYAAPGPNHPRRGRFWVPLISLWTGMRLNECCQLLVADVRVIDGTDCIVIQETDEQGEGGKRVKTEAGERYVPVHPELRRIGLLEFVAAQREAGERRLFPELKRGSHDYLSDNFQKWWARFTKKAGAARPRTSFHSFRHCYRDALREADISTERARALGGWSRGDGADASYGDGLRPSTLAAEIAKVTYPGLDLSHIYRIGVQRRGPNPSLGRP
ncbi:MAG TPA: site-specific integrase [Stellaceae bacterium]|nr:site-specific integrase [Stellaceae bacterium]